MVEQQRQRQKVFGAMLMGVGIALLTGTIGGPWRLQGGAEGLSVAVGIFATAIGALIWRRASLVRIACRKLGCDGLLEVPVGQWVPGASDDRCPICRNSLLPTSS